MPVPFSTMTCGAFTASPVIVMLVLLVPLAGAVYVNGIVQDAPMATVEQVEVSDVKGAVTAVNDELRLAVPVFVI